MNECLCGCKKLTHRTWYVGHCNKGRKHPDHIRKKFANKLEKNGRWKGGQMVDKNGYILIKNNSHPFANNSGYVREHRLVMEKHIGRFLTPKEIVHHLNHIPNDNRIENLSLKKDSAEHIKECRTGRKFPRKNGVWFICERCNHEFYRSNCHKNKPAKWCSWICRYPK